MLQCTVAKTKFNMENMEKRGMSFFGSFNPFGMNTSCNVSLYHGKKNPAQNGFRCMWDITSMLRLIYKLNVGNDNELIVD